MKGKVFSIEEFSVYDGPGIRTSVFLKGCPLSCSWCHNPEGKSFETEYFRMPNGCIKCGRCTQHSKKLEARSVDLCPNNLIKRYGDDYSSTELTDIILKNERLLNVLDGGVTFSGGEPTAQPEFLLECLSLLEGRLHRAIQTCGFCDKNIFESIVSKTDLVLFDLKLIDSTLSKRYVGVSTENIIANFIHLTKSKTKYIVRMPLIPTVTDTDENLALAAKLMNDNGARYIELLPYNRFAGAKYKLTGKEYRPDFDDTQALNINLDIFNNYKIKTKVM